MSMLRHRSIFEARRRLGGKYVSWSLHRGEFQVLRRSVGEVRYKGNDAVLVVVSFYCLYNMAHEFTRCSLRNTKKNA